MPVRKEECAHVQRASFGRRRYGDLLRLPDGRRGRETGPCQRRLRSRGAALRRDERHHVRRHPPALEGRHGDRARTAEARRMRVLDVAGGTGDVAFRIVRASGGKAQCDRAGHQRRDAGRRRGAGRPDAPRRQSRFRRGECGGAALPDTSFDAYTIAFGIRNVPRHRQGAVGGLSGAEARRPLLCLEFRRWRCRSSKRSTRLGRST